MQGFAQGYYRFCLWVTRIFYVHVLWILFTVIGLGVFGIMPATAAMFAVVRKWIRGEDDFPIFKTFKDSFRAEFIKGNILGYILLAVGYILYLDLQFVRIQATIPFQALTYLVMIIFLLYFIVLLYVFPVFVHFKLTMVQYLKWPIGIGIMHPIITIFVVIALLATYYVTLVVIPAIFILSGITPAAFIISFGAKLVFDKLQEKGEEASAKEA